MRKSHALVLTTTLVVTSMAAIFSAAHITNAEVVIHLNRNGLNLNRGLEGRLNRMIGRFCLLLPDGVAFLGWCTDNTNTNVNVNTNTNSNSNQNTNQNSNTNTNQNSNSNNNSNSNSNTNAPVNQNTNTNTNTNSNTNTNTNTNSPGGGQSSSGVLVSEVFETAPNNAEWVEIHNGSGIAMDFNGWMIGDGTSFDTIPATGLIPNGGTLLIVATSTPGFLGSLPATATKIFIDTTITPSGMNSSGEAIVLKNDQGTVVDAMNFGSITSQFSPSVSLAPSGESLFRTTLGSDSNTAADWGHHSPNPGIVP